MAKWKYRWVCPHWEFHTYQEDAPDVAFEERNREGTSTFVHLLSLHPGEVEVRGHFYDLDGNPDTRFGFDASLSLNSAFAYRVDDGSPQFPKPAPGSSVSAKGWFEVLATQRIYLAAYVQGEFYNARSRAWGYHLPVEEASLRDYREDILFSTTAVTDVGSAIAGFEVELPDPGGGKGR